jgi:hypothetical protein
MIKTLTANAQTGAVDFTLPTVQLDATPAPIPQTINLDPITLDLADSVGIELWFAYGSGAGTECKVYVQSTLDGGNQWFDVACVVFGIVSERQILSLTRGATPLTTPTDGTMADDTILNNGVVPLGTKLRLKVLVDGVYVQTILSGRATV